MYLDYVHWLKSNPDRFLNGIFKVLYLVKMKKTEHLYKIKEPLINYLENNAQTIQEYI